MSLILAQKAGKTRGEAHCARKSFTSSKSIAAIPGPTAAAEVKPVCLLFAHNLGSRLTSILVRPHSQQSLRRDHAAFTPSALASSPRACRQPYLFHFLRAGEIFQTRF